MATIKVLHLVAGFTLLYSVQCQSTVRFIALTESQQVSIPQIFSEGVKKAEEANDFKLDETTIDISREGEEEGYQKLCQEVKNGVSAILDFTWTGWYKSKKLAEDAGIPYLRIDATISPFVQAVDDYLRKRNGTDAALIFQNEAELDQSLYYLIGNSILRVIVLNRLQDNTTAGLKKMRPTPSYFVIFASTENMRTIFSTALSGQLVSRDSRWNLVFTDFSYDQFDKKMLDVTVSLIHMKKSVCCRLLKQNMDCSCPQDMEIIPQFIRNVLQYLGDIVKTVTAEAMAPKEVDCSAPTKDPSVSQQFYDAIQPLSQNHESVGYDNKEKMMYYRSDMELYSANKENNTHIGTWTKEAGFQLAVDYEMVPIKKFFRVGTIESIPWAYMKKDSNGSPIKDENGKEIWEGYCIDLLEKLAENMNFDYELVFPENGNYGKRYENGSWDGIIGDLAKGETDIVVAALTMTSEREEVVDFVAPYFDQSGISIVIRKPVRKTSLFKFMTVLKLEVWLSIVGALSVTGVMIWILDKYSPYSAQNNKEMYPYPCREFTLKESFWFALTSFTPQGGGEAPKALSGRTLVAAYWLFVVLMLATFTANLAAFLTVERMQTPVASLDELARQSKINYTLMADTSIEQYFINMAGAEQELYRVWKEITLNSTSDQTKYRVWDYPIKEQYGHILLAINNTGPVANATVGFQKVLDSEDGEFAFIHDAMEIRYEVYRNCNLTEVGEPFAEQPYAIAVQQGSHLQEEISRRILDLQKERYFETLSGRYWNASQRGSCPNTDDSEGITLESLGGVFIATLFGLALAMITLAGEVFYHKRKQKKSVHVMNNKPVTIGSEFKPADKMPRVSYISVFPRN